MKFLRYLTEGIEDKGIFKAVFMAGHPGAGKTYTLSKIKSGSIEPRLVNTDKFVEHFKNADWMAIGDKVRRLNNNQLVLYLNSMLPLAVDGTSGSIQAMLRRRGLLESMGYDTAMVFVNTDLETAIRRVQSRDRKVEEEFIRESFKKLNENKKFYRSKFDTFIEVDNNDGELTNKVMIHAFNFLTAFYNAPVKNIIGKRRIERMKRTKQKYLNPNEMSLDEIKKIVSVWYRK
jgi:shikimate kinase